MKAFSRREFLKYLGVGTAGLSAAALLAACSGKTDNTSPSADTSSTGGNTSSQEAIKEAEERSEAGWSSELIADNETATDSYIMPIIRGKMSATSTIAPHLTAGQVNAGQVLRLAYQGLMEQVVFGGDPSPLLADPDKGERGGWDHEDGTVFYTIYLRENIHDSEGNPIDANDVKFCYDYTYGTSGLQSSNTFVACEVIDKYTIKFEFNRELVNHGEVATFFGLNIFSQKHFEASSDPLSRHACGTGPYIVTDFTPEASADLELYDGYWAEDVELSKLWKTNVQHVRYDCINETAQVVIALQQGNLDYSDLSSAYVGEFENDDRYQILTLKNNVCRMIYFNCHPDTKCGDINLRLAIANAVNIDQVNEGLGKGYGARLYGPGNTNYPDYDPAWEKLDNYNTRVGAGDKEVVQKYLDAAGYKGEELVLMTASNDDVKNISVIIQSQLMQYGINVKLDPRDNTALNQAKSDYTAWDMQIGEQASRGLCASIMAGQAFNASEASFATYGGVSANFIDDPYLDEISDEILNVNTYSQEGVDRQWKYLIEKCYVVGLQCNYTNHVLPANVTSVCINASNQLHITACTFSDPNA